MAEAHRYAGDGLDFRRPITSQSRHSVTSAAPVIDLTEGDNAHDTGAEGTATAQSSRARRLPRFGRELIEVADEPEPEPAFVPRPSLRVPQFAGLRRPARYRQPTPPGMDGDDDFEIVSERALSRPISRQHTPGVPRSITPYPIDLTNDDDVVITDSRIREGGVNAVRPGTTAGVGTRSVVGGGDFGVGHIANILRGRGADIGGRLLQRLGATMVDLDDGMDDAMLGHSHHHHNRGITRGLHFAAGPPHAMANMHMPAMMDFDGVGFDMGLVGGQRPASPKYSPPPDAPEGFTRNPAEDEVVVCPNCGDELAMGDDDDVKQQVWVVKGCGHAYCGECAHNRSRSASKKGKGKATASSAFLPSPFKKCVVEGCGKSTGKTMFQLYLGS
ncbi:hypothetical protein LTR36_008352 [Oleoguttula mirabilis]|uniref:Uncharacterized protein n=1 Tax=Oleoguttula mirabilis TaxID=1507867 RepID=A0AAV9J7V2_9PEZI|nr:hypothetical protein LTR36_008352 [Oleoguttula mirabilis]